MIKNILEPWTEEELLDRNNYIGGSDAPVIMHGKHFSKTVKALWAEKTGRVPLENLNGVLRVQMGTWTEELNRLWYIQETGYPVSTENCKFQLHPEHKFIRASLDGRVMIDDVEGVWEAKHTSAWNKSSPTKTYFPQLQHNMLTTGLTYAILSVFQDNSKHLTFRVERDDWYIDKLLEKEVDFWKCVTEDKEPNG